MALTLRWGGEEYGIDILSVQEFRSCEPLARSASAAAHAWRDQLARRDRARRRPSPPLHTTDFATLGEGERSRVLIARDIVDLITDADRALRAQAPQQSPTKRQP